MYHIPKCAICNSTCEPVRQLTYNKHTKQYDTTYRALYFNKEFDLDFCCPECSVKHREDVYDIESELYGLLS